MHGCLQERGKVGILYANNAGYNQVADINNIIVVYPQAKSSTFTNPNGCWDWWGYADYNYCNELIFHKNIYLILFLKQFF